MATIAIYVTVRLDFENPKADTMTKVVFRKWRNGDVIALFPDDVNPYDSTVISYMHVGQHGAADYAYVVYKTHPAQPDEYRSLLSELRNIGYDDLRIIRHARLKYN